MKPITINELESLISDWAVMKESQMTELGLPFYSQGGWEGWVQVELAMFLTSNGYDVIREDRIYQGQEYRADLVINSNCADTYHPPIAIEIKCQSIYLTEAALYGAIETDERKLANLVDWRKLMLVFTVDQQTTDILQNQKNYEILKVPNGFFAIMYKIL